MLQRIRTLRAAILAIAALTLTCLVILWGLTTPHTGIAAAGLQRANNARPVNTITWQPESDFNEPVNNNIAPAVHPTDPLRALVSGPTPIRYTTDGGASWQSGSGLVGAGVPVWLPGGNGQSALHVSSSQANTLNFYRSTDSGAHWASLSTLTMPNIAVDVPYMWADANPSSPYYGRIYLTLTMLDAAHTGSYDTVGLLSSTDQGATWSAPAVLADPTEFGRRVNYNAFASAAIQPNGGVVVAWHRGKCCQTITDVPNKIMWSRSTDGGVTFPVSGTIATVPVSQSLEYNSNAQGGFRWTPAPNIAADPVDGTLYAVWVAFRQPNTIMSAAVYLSRSTDNGTSWSEPVVVDNNGPYIYQYMPWVQVSPDHVVHVTYQGAVIADMAAHFYIQSTDRGATWSTPFHINTGQGYTYFGQGDYQATSLGGYNGSQGAILTSWQIMVGSGVRMGTFPLGGGGTPTATATPTCVPEGTPGPWISTAGYPQMFTDIAVASDGTAVYGFGGRNPSGMHGLAYKYAGNTWTPIASLSAAIAEAGAEYGHNGKIYVFPPGGSNFIYDIATNSWSSGAWDPQGVYGIRGHAYWNGKIYVIGGYVNGAPATAVSAYDIATDSWSTLAPLPQGEDAMASAAINGKIYVANGQVAGGVTNNLYIYDIATNVWTQGASSPSASSSPGSTAIGGKLYMIGGLVNGYTSNTYLYDPATNSWSQGPSLKVARDGGNAATINTSGGETAVVVGGLSTGGWTNSTEASTAPLVPCGTSSPTATRATTPTATPTCVVAGAPGPWISRAGYPQMLTDIAVASDGTTVYAFGGRNGSGRHTQAYKYNYATDSWTAIASFPYDAIGEAEAEYGHNGKIYVIWGNGTYIYDIATNSWSLGAPTPQSELSFAHAYWNGKIYVIGGYVNNAINSVYAYDIATDTWSTLAPLPQAEGLTAAAAINGKIYVANGQMAGGVTNNLYIYDIATDTWSSGLSSPLASAAPGSAAIGGKLYMIGGGPQGTIATANTYLYDPASNSWSQGPSLNVARKGGNAAIINTPGGQTAIVVGGADGAVWLNSVEASTAPLVPCGTATATATATRTSTAAATATCVPAGAPGPWAVAADYPQGLTDIAVASDGTTVYAFGGRNSSGRHTQAYKYAGNTWDPIANMPDAIGEAEAEYGHNGKIYVIWYVFNFIYDIATNSWSSGAPPPQSETNFGHAYWNGKIYVIGGLGSDVSNAVYAYDIATDTWSTLAPLPQAEGLTAAAAINGKIYVANGQMAGGVTNNLYIYNIATDTWSSGLSSPLASAAPGGTVIAGKLYLIGGQPYNQPYSTNTYLYDPASNSWSQGPSLNVGRYGGNAATINTSGGETAMVIGGFGANMWLNGVETSTAPLVPCGTSSPTATATHTTTPTATATCVAAGEPGPWDSKANYPRTLGGVAVASDGSNIYGLAGWDYGWFTQAYKYNYAADSWTAIATVTSAAGIGGAEYGQNGKIYVMGGGSDPGPSPNQVYDIASNSWSLGAPLPDHMSGFAHAYWNGKIYLIGGTAPSGVTNAVYAYDIAANTWSTLAPLPRAEFGMASAAINGKIYVANGSTGGDIVTNNLYIYDIASDTWAQGPPSPLASYLPGSTAIGGKLYMVGGDPQGGGGHTDNTYLYDPVTNSWSQGPNLNVSRSSADAATINTAGGQVAIIVGGYGSGTSYLNSVEASTAPLVPCSTVTATATHTPVPPTSTSTIAVPSGTAAPPTSTFTATSTATPCAISFTDVHPTDYFYQAVQYLYCHGAISGYADGTFRPYNNTTRAQLTKIIVLAEGWNVDCPQTGHFTDVAPDDTFYCYIETAYEHGIISGYDNHTFRPGSNVTRGQLCKIIVLAQNWTIDTTGGPHFTDVPQTHSFYNYVETSFNHNIITGYSDGTFRPANSATRGQISKIVYLAITQ